MTTTWQNDAACRGMDAELFYTERGEPTAQAKAVCADCDVSEECLDFALAGSEKFGIWGGKSERERRRLRRKIRTGSVTARPRVKAREPAEIEQPPPAALRATCNWCGTSLEPGELLCAEARACDHFLDSRRQRAFWLRLVEISDRLAEMDPIELQAWLGVEWPYVHEIGHARRGCPTKAVVDRQLVGASA